MSTESFLQDLKLPASADIDAVEGAFLETLKERLRTVAEQYNETELRGEDQWLRGFLEQYFDYARSWTDREAGKYQDIKEYDTAPGIKKQARNVVGELQDYIKEFVSCYMHINRFMTLLRDEIKKEEIRAARTAARRTKWTADSGFVIARHRKEKKQILERMARLQKARPLLSDVENDFDIMRESVYAAFGKDKAEPFLRRFNSAVRVTDFRKARKALQDIGGTKKKFGVDQKTAAAAIGKIQASGGKIIGLIEKDTKLFASNEDNKVFLKPVEIDMAINGDIRELQKIKNFLAKYHLPYMQYKLDSLNHLKDKLLILNTLESLMALYKKLIMGIALPLADMKTVRLYESEVLNHTQYLLTGHFTELPKILQRAEETVGEFRQSRIELQEFEKLNLSEVPVKEKNAAV